MRQAFLSVDFDQWDYARECRVDEFRLHAQALANILRETAVRSTFFVRVDDFEFANSGAPRDLSQVDFARVRLEAAAQLDPNVEVGWHIHCTSSPHSFEPVTNTHSMVEQIQRWGPIVSRLGVSVSRIGWGQGDLAALRALASVGMTVDSSAIIRPNYPWMNVPLCAWEDWPAVPTAPFAHDGGLAGFWEVPISVVELTRPNDTIPNVRRYLNPTYDREEFQRGLAAWSDTTGAEILMLIFHPHELLGWNGFPASEKRKRVADFRRNIHLVESFGFQFGALSCWPSSGGSTR